MGWIDLCQALETGLPGLSQSSELAAKNPLQLYQHLRSADVQGSCWFPSSPFPLSHKGLFKAQFLISYWDPFLDAEIKKIRGSKTGYVSVMLTKLQACSQLLYRKILTIFNHRKLPREAQVTSFYTVTMQERFHLE